MLDRVCRGHREKRIARIRRRQHLEEKSLKAEGYVGQAAIPPRRRSRSRTITKPGLPPGIPRAPVRSPICLVVESGVLVDLGGLQLAVGNRLLQA